jgi:predicted deacetylase
MTKLPRSLFLLRIDDLCPTVAAEPWRQLVELIEGFQLQPILAVVPDNGDPDLDQSPPDPRFWEQMRDLQSAGASIGLHGYRHVCASAGRSFVPLARRSEFARVPVSTQRIWISEGMRILRHQGLHPRIWVAPRHGFDASTLCALKAEGITMLSDGFAQRPFLRAGFTWIPQQLWAPRAKRSGLWTICVHPNTARAAEIEALRAFLHEHAAQFTSVDRALAAFPPRAFTLAERTEAQLVLWRVRFRRLRKGSALHRPQPAVFRASQ